MSGYGYGPPPPPPSSGGYNSHQGPSGSPARGGNHGRGRGGGHRGGYSGGLNNNNRYQYPAQPYQQPGAAPYGAAPGHHAPTGYGHQQAQWAPDHGRQTHAHTPIPLSSANYHPNYTAQHYPPGQYPQQSAYQPPQYSAPYQGGAHPQPHHQAPTHWNGQAAAGRHHAAPAPPAPYQPPHPAGAGYAQAYPADPRTAHYPPAQPYPYSGPPPPPPGNSHHAQHGHNQRHGRGGPHRDGGRGGRGGRGGGRGGRGGHMADRNRDNRPARNDHHNSNQNANNNSNINNKKKADASSGNKKKKRKTNTLGLTPVMDSESEDDEGEETALQELIGADALKVSDIAAFIAERKKKFPTKARVEAKKAAEQAQKKEEKTSKLEKQADELRKQLRKVESSIKRKREHDDEGDEVRGASNDEGSDNDKPEVMSSGPSAATGSKPLPADKRADISRHCKYYSTGGSCSKKGKCRFVHDPEVREAATREREANNGRLTIQQRLILNDKDQEDLAVLQSIRYLREKGIMPEAPPSVPAEEKQAEDSKPDEQVSETKQQQPAAAEKDEDASSAIPKPGSANSLLPAAPPSLPQPLAKRESGVESKPAPQTSAAESDSDQTKHYQGWVLEPYGSKK